MTDELKESIRKTVERKVKDYEETRRAGGSS
jgi:hypothetical protein